MENYGHKGVTWAQLWQNMSMCIVAKGLADLIHFGHSDNLM